MKKVVLRVLLGLLILFVVIQLYRPDRTNPPIDQSKTLEAATVVPAPVTAILERSCYNCHSSKTDLPWYSQIAPFSWWLKGHIDDGREAFSFSEWATYTPQKMVRRLNGICREVEEGGMPLDSYTLIHRNAILSDADKKTLCDWTKAEGARLVALHPEAAAKTGPPEGE